MAFTKRPAAFVGSFGAGQIAPKRAAKGLCRRSDGQRPRLHRGSNWTIARPHVRASTCACAEPFPQTPEARALKAAVKEVKSLLKKCPLYFVGCMGCGKSAVAKYAAYELGYRFLDTDELVELAAGGIPVSKIFSEVGEDAFRDLESAVLDQVQAFMSTCVATGGGAVLRNENWARMQTGIVVFLDVPPRVLAERLDGDATRPLLAGLDGIDAKEARLSEILESRRVRYELADVTVPISGEQPVDDIASDIFRRVANFVKSNPPRFAEAASSLYPKDTPRPPPPSSAGG